MKVAFRLQNGVTEKGGVGLRMHDISLIPAPAIALCYLMSVLLEAAATGHLLNCS